MFVFFRAQTHLINLKNRQIRQQTIAEEDEESNNPNSSVDEKKPEAV